MLGPLSHIAVIVTDLPAAIDRFQSLLGARLVEREHLRQSGTDVAVLELGGAHIEFLTSRVPDSKVGHLLRERGEGIHHLSFQVENITTELARWQARGLRLLDAVPRAGLHGRRIAFLDPEDTAGILIELVEESRRSKEDSL